MSDDKIFRRHFDRGTRVPQGLTEEAPPGPVEPPLPPIPEVEALVQARGDLETLKKALLAMCTPVDAMANTRTLLRGGAHDPEKRQKYERTLEEQKSKRSLAIQHVLNCTGEDRKEAIDDLIAIALRDDLTKEEAADLNMRARRVTQSIFAEQKRMLQEIKELKKKQREELHQ